MTAFFDTSVVIALADPSEANHGWSISELATRQKNGPVVISDMVYAEVSAGMPDKASVDAVIARFGFDRALPDDAALFDAGQRYKIYRSNNGQKTNVLSDFLIGAAARSLGIPLVTANPKDFRTFFSGLTIVHPGGQEIVP